MQVTVRDHLRQSTRAMHERLDNHPSLTALSSTESSIDAIAAALKTLRVAYKEIEILLVETSIPLSHELIYPLPDWSAHLDEDLSSLSLGGTAEGEPQKSKSTRASPNSSAYWLGVLYVVYGSSLGANRLAKTLAQHSNPSVRRITFFDYNSGFAARFKLLIAFLDELQCDARGRLELVEGARGAFSLFLAQTEARSCYPNKIINEPSAPVSG